MIMHSGGSRLTTLSLVVVWVLIGCSSPTGVAPIEERAQPPSRDLRLHIVDHNETLYSVAFRYEKDYRDLAEINGLYPPYTLQFQQRIYLLAEAVPDSVRQPIQVRDSELNQSAVSPSIATREPASAPVRTRPSDLLFGFHSNTIYIIYTVTFGSHDSTGIDFGSGPCANRGARANAQKWSGSTARGDLTGNRQ